MRAYDHLVKYGIRPSAQRLSIMEYLLSHRTHPTSDEIFENLKETIPTLSKTTVYNTLKHFHEKGAVLHLSIDHKNARFDGYTHPHAHFLCSRCGCVADLDLKIAPEVDVPMGLSVKEVLVYLYGLCESCKESETNSNY